MQEITGNTNKGFYLSHASRLRIVQVCIIAFTLIVALLSIWGISRTTTLYADENSGPITRLHLVSSIRVSIQSEEHDYTDALMQRYFAVPAYTVGDLSKVNNDKQALATALSQYRRFSLNNEEKTALAKFDKAYTPWLNELNDLIAALYEPSMRANYMISDWMPLATTLSNQIKPMEDAAQLSIDQAQSNAIASTSQVNLIIIAVFVITFVLVVILSNAIARNITRQFQVVVTLMQRVARGDLTIDPTTSSKFDQRDESGKIAQRFFGLLTRLRSLVDAVRTVTDEVEGQVGRITGISHEKSVMTKQVAQSIQQVATGTSEQSGVLVNSVDEVNLLAQQSAESQSKAHETITAMHDLKESVIVSAESLRKLGQRSDQIGQIVQTIDEIARQTNLLALNAAIEAARAGEYGKGFSVVADEVRKLSERSSSATKEIGAIVHETQAETDAAIHAMEQGIGYVETGAARVNAAGNQATAIAQSSDDTRDNLTTVAAVSEQNSAAAEEVAAGTSEMALQIDETDISTRSLLETMHQLREAVDAFQLAA
jgi:methyl-accepting chemotaxis protein